MHLELSDEERVLLVNLLSSSLSETREEIYRTESFDYKTAVKAEKKIILDLLAKLSLPAGEVTHN